ncbi:HypC/HybG/HupF family hydrogenase formation chaperone [Demequina sp. NBRC 110052]|uniref:HypC/HybG/HupF family hydrogenase formation chaperone n=1 Tax=Demequina sp. NBRC 110052 TaxID=1570341 RepID=UPI000A047E22|nr:HypC/HybG/HupF family hydrogenase formation chaperone [Demequina sp. NBRC 110052]
MESGTFAKVLEVHHDGRAVVEHDDLREEVLEMTIQDDDIAPGDWVVIRSGFALERLTEEQVKAARKARGKAAPAS